MVAITDSTGSITDTFEYDTYGNVTERTGDSFVIFGYNGRDGVVTDKNGLIYMRARYYSPEMRRFVNADILRGEISDSTSLNRYSYVNGNPVSFVDPLGLAKEKENWYGAHGDVKSTFTTIDTSYNLLGDVIKVYHKQTVTRSMQYGEEGSLLDAYQYIDINFTDETFSLGAGLKLLYLLGFDVNFKSDGVEAVLSYDTEDTSMYASFEMDLFGDTTAAVGIVIESEDNVELNNQFGISGDTWWVLYTTVAIIYGFQPSVNAAPKSVPVPVPSIG